MPKLDIGVMDYSSIPRDVHGQTLLRMEREQAVYWTALFFLGGFFFLISAVF